MKVKLKTENWNRKLSMHIIQKVFATGLFYRYYFDWCSSELAELVSLPCSWGRSNSYSDRLHDFSLTIPTCYKDVYVNSFFPLTARIWNSLPIDCFPLTYDLNNFESRVYRHLLSICSVETVLLFAFDLFLLLSLATPCFAMALQPFTEKKNPKKKKKLIFINILSIC